MIAMIFEVWPDEDFREAYLDIAAELRPLADASGGLLSIERFESLYEPGKILSLGFFTDEAAVTAWRNSPEHRAAQAAGRNQYFRDYRLRIAAVSRDYAKDSREQAPEDSQRVLIRNDPDS